MQSKIAKIKLSMIKAIYKLLQSNWCLIILILLAPVFFAIYSWLPQQTLGQGVYQFNSPDETGNFFWSKRFAAGQSLYVEEPLELPGNNLIRLRGTNVADGKLVPGSFLGLNFIYGTLGYLFGEEVIPYLTPLFAVVGVLFFYALIALVFDKRIALISALLACSMPGWLYLANRSMYHNVLFVSLLMVGIYLLYKVFITGYRLPVTRYILYALAGLFVGLALITRMSELGWVFLILLLLFIFNFKRINWAGFTLFASFLLITFVPVIGTNLILYHAPFSIGYDTGLAGEFETLITQAPLLFRLLVSPFGIDLSSIGINGVNYLILFFWWLTWPALFGFIFWLFSRPGRRQPEQTEDSPTLPRMIKDKKRQWAYFVIMLVVTCYLLIFYGSWQLTDRIDEQSVFIGTSYVRYFLPIYMMLLVYVAFLINSFIKIFRYSWAKLIIAFLSIIFFAIPSYLVAFFSVDESLIALRETLKVQEIKAEKARQALPEESVVVAGFKQADKIFFPERRVIPELAVPHDYESLASLAKIRSLYYYHFAPTTTVEFISRRDFEPYGLKIQAASSTVIFNNERLYPVVVSH